LLRHGYHKSPTAIVIVGLPDAAVKESRDRVSTALTNSGFKFPVDPVRQEAP
jgi:magnesium chelatase family protein